MEDLGLSQAVVNLLTRSILFCLPLLVGGCGFLPEWFLPAEKISRLQTNDALQSNLKDKKETISDKLKELNQQSPRLIEPLDALIEPISQNNLSKCKSIIGAREEVIASADKSNYGERLSEDAWGRSIVGSPQLIVLHETVLGEMETVNLFKTQHLRDQDQASYHLLVGRDGSLLRIVPDSKRAFGAGMSAFGDVTQRTKQGSVGSINNIALHIGLVSPDDGRDDRHSHSGYSDFQYKSLAKQILLWQARYGIPLTRVTSHAFVDRSHSRYDPRSFRWDKFDSFYKVFATRCSLQYLDNGLASL